MVLHRMGLVVHGGKPRAVETAAEIETWARRRSVEAQQLDVWSADTERRNAREELSAAGPLDLIVTVGGDGTFLRGMRLAMAADVPVLGVDVGRVGFLTEVEAEKALSALEAFAAGNALIEQRLTLTLRANRPLSIPDGLEALLRYGRGPALPPPPVHASSPEEVGWGVGLDIAALNDVTFEKLSRDRQISLSMAVIVLERSGQVVVSVDGQIRGVLDPGDWLAVYARPKRAQLVRLREPDFFGRVRDRFRVADAVAAEADGRAPPFYRPNLPVPPDLRHLYLPQVAEDEHDQQSRRDGRGEGS